MPNDLWASCILETCFLHGVRYVVLCPGARSTPLAVALYNLVYASKPDRQALWGGRPHVVTHYDERGAAFYALGIAKATHTPVVVVTTSGTAVANLLPALLEAKKSSVSIVLLTADRPPELAFSGANQTFDQSSFLSQAVIHSHTLATPTDDVSARALAYTVAYTVAKAHAQRQPVHLNCPFREPLSSYPTYMVPIESIPRVHGGYTLAEVPAYVKHILEKTSSGVLVVGGECDPLAALSLSIHYGWPIVPDVCSPLRYMLHPNIITYSELEAGLETLGTATCLLHLGDPVTSRELSLWIQKHAGVLIRYHHRDDFGDPLFQAIYIGIGEIPWEALRDVSTQKSSFPMPSPSLDMRVSDLLETDETEYAILHKWDLWLPEGWALFLGNSKPIRQMGQVAKPSARPVLQVGSNRGLSGIDGVMASAGGFFSGLGCPGCLILGDLSYFHDLSSLPLISSLPILVLVIQNYGGDIFSRFGVRQHPSFEAFFYLPHAYSCADAARWAFGFVQRVSGADALSQISSAVSWIQSHQRAALLEIVVGQTPSSHVIDRLR